MADTGTRQRLQLALGEALRARDKVATSALRSALAAIDNASAAVLLSAVDPAGTAAAEAAAVAAFWRDLGLPGLVDIHTHFMPPNVLAKVWAFFEGGRAGVGRAWPIAYRLPEEERVPASISPTSVSLRAPAGSAGPPGPRRGVAAGGLPRQRRAAARPVSAAVACREAGSHSLEACEGSFHR